MSNVDAQIKRLLSNDCPVKTLSTILSDLTVSAENCSEIEDLVSTLEIHENELRQLRQSLTLRLRQYSIEYYFEYLKKKNLE